MPIKLVVGLKNPDADYGLTRHNAGAWLVNIFANQQHVVFKNEKKMRAECVFCDVDGERCLLMLPSLFMNQSGEAVQAACHFYAFKPEEVLVVHDDMDLPVGTIKLKSAGGHGGHNGLKSVISHLGSQNFHRLRVGIGHPGHKDLVLNYVLGKPSVADKTLMLTAIDQALTLMPRMISGDIASAQMLLNT